MRLARVTAELGGCPTSAATHACAAACKSYCSYASLCCAARMWPMLAPFVPRMLRQLILQAGSLPTVDGGTGRCGWLGCLECRCLDPSHIAAWEQGMWACCSRGGAWPSAGLQS